MSWAKRFIPAKNSSLASKSVSSGEGFAIEADPTQLREIKELLENLPENIRKNAMNGAMKRSAKRVQDRAKAILEAATGVDSTGRLARNIIIKKKDGKYKGKFFKRTVGVPRGKSRKDPDGAFYAHFVEYGHRIVGPTKKDTGKKVPAVHFLLKGLEQTNPINVADFQRVVREEVDKRVKRIPKAKRAALGL